MKKNCDKPHVKPSAHHAVKIGTHFILDHPISICIFIPIKFVMRTDNKITSIPASEVTV